MFRRALPSVGGGAEWLQRASPFTFASMSRNGRIVTTSATEICSWDAPTARMLTCKALLPANRAKRIATVSPGGTWVLIYPSVDREFDRPTTMPTSRALRDVWLAESGRSTALLSPLMKASRFSVSANDRFIATVQSLPGTGQGLTLLDAAGKSLCTAPVEGAIHSIFVSPNANTIVTATRRDITLWSGKCRKIRGLPIPSGYFTRYASDPADQILAIGTAVEHRPMTVHVFDSTTHAERFPPLKTDVSREEALMAISRDGTRLAVGRASVGIYDTINGSLIRRKAAGCGQTRSDSMCIAASLERGGAEIRLADVFANRSKAIALPGELPDLVDASADVADHLAILRDGVVRIFDLRRPVVDYPHAGFEQLRAEACHALRNQQQAIIVRSSCP